VTRLALLAAAALVVAGCGSGGTKVDEGGFTSAQRAAAQSALDRLRQTSIPRRIVAISYRSGQAPATCTVMPGTGSDGSFRLVVAWGVLRPQYKSVPRNLIEATIGPTAKDVRFRVTPFGGPVPESPTVQATLARAALAHPAEQCEVLESGSLQLVSQQ
jgi:hypothetical protein